jgi:hypothetical protein
MTTYITNIFQRYETLKCQIGCLVEWYIYTVRTASELRISIIVAAHAPTHNPLIHSAYTVRYFRIITPLMRRKQTFIAMLSHRFLPRISTCVGMQVKVYLHQFVPKYLLYPEITRLR